MVQATTKKIQGSAGSQIISEAFAIFHNPWAMSFLPDGDLLITEKNGALFLFSPDSRAKASVMGVPEVSLAGQGGLGDVIIHPQYHKNNWIYLSYVEQDKAGNRGAVVLRARLNTQVKPLKLKEKQVIWKQEPKVSGSGHYSYRLAFSPDDKLFITSGDRQKQAPAQEWTQNLGKVIRLNDDGSLPLDNPFQNKGELAKTFWSLGHRNVLGIAFDQQGRLWTHEMGPKDGDELNLTLAGGNYGWPLVSWGDQYSGIAIADHDTRPEFNAPEVYWIPTIAPSGLIIYSGTMFTKWKGNALIGGLRSQSLIRVVIKGDKAFEAERFLLNSRIREVDQDDNGAIWILEDKQGAKLLRLTPYR
ncbi:PQQ-dependent sugar dehydrogenase [Psychromonas sp. psych-6C06]|uniref:PQQ-dependent sugar dehydrogenase n=1 Tax=Psychromonas sp. psych-6C06 TaxID=2058089 RepID=UPI001EE772F1|nr:PQQ-dependent sugar dehydrogenase [Psychromonas sp. psych-6C06]